MRDRMRRVLLPNFPKSATSLNKQDIHYLSERLAFDLDRVNKNKTFKSKKRSLSRRSDDSTDSSDTEEMQFLRSNNVDAAPAPCAAKSISSLSTNGNKLKQIRLEKLHTETTDTNGAEEPKDEELLATIFDNGPSCVKEGHGDNDSILLIDDEITEQSKNNDQNGIMIIEDSELIFQRIPITGKETIKCEKTTSPLKIKGGKLLRSSDVNVSAPPGVQINGFENRTPESGTMQSTTTKKPNHINLSAPDFHKPFTSLRGKISNANDQQRSQKSSDALSQRQTRGNGAVLESLPDEKDQMSGFLLDAVVQGAIKPDEVLKVKQQISLLNSLSKNYNVPIRCVLQDLKNLKTDNGFKDLSELEKEISKKYSTSSV